MPNKKSHDRAPGKRAFSIALPESLIDQIEAIADEESRSRNGQIEYFLSRSVKDWNEKHHAPAKQLRIVAEDAAPYDAGKKPAHPYWIDLLGGVAAGSKIFPGDAPAAPLNVAKDYGADCYALKVFGHSMEPKVADGAVIVVKRLAAGVKPKKGAVVVYQDAHGASLKEFGYRKAQAGEEADAMGNVPVLRSINKTFADVETLDGGKVEAVLVEVV